jgi:hypothetical protein
MAEESKFVKIALAAAQRVVTAPMTVQQGKALLYQVTVDNSLELTVDPKHPRRGDSAFQTDLCLFEEKSGGIVIPRVVLEFKESITTHDILTYSAKARKHKQVYPYLRYGIVVAKEDAVPRRFFVHNEALDFFAAVKDVAEWELDTIFAKLFEAELRTSKLMEQIAFSGERPKFFRSEIIVTPYMG